MSLESALSRREGERSARHEKEVFVISQRTGRIYFPSGTPDLDEINGGAVDIAGSAVRAVAEETGPTVADYHAAPHWDCVVSGAAVAMIRILNVDATGEALRARIEANLAGQQQPELSAIHWSAMSEISPRRCRASSRPSSKRSKKMYAIIS